MSLILTNLNVSVEEIPIISNLSLTIAPGSIHALMGPNGSGKSSLAYTLMGHPRYTIHAGAILFNNSDITELSPDKRAKLGIFLAFQQPYEIPGVSITTFLKAAYEAVTNTVLSVKEFKDYMISKMDILGMDHSFASRSINEGFSGGEKKRFEMLQLLILQPKLVILDEIDSGLDVDALKFVAAGLAAARAENPVLSCIIITHYQRILEHIVPDYVHVLYRGSLVQSGSAILARQIEEKGYDAFCSAQKK